MPAVVTGRQIGLNPPRTTQAGRAIGGVVAYLEPYPGREFGPVDATHRRSAALGRRREGRQAFLAIWLADTLEPGDKVVASVQGFVSQLGALGVVSGAVGLAGIYPGWLDWASRSGRVVHALVALLVAAASTWSLAELRLRKALSVVVTERQLTLVQLNLRHEPIRVLAALPISAASLTTGRRSLTITTADGSPLQIRGKARARLKLRVIDRRTQLEGVVAAVAASGGMVNLPPPAVAIGRLP